MTVIAISRPLREKLGDDGAEALAELINKTGQSGPEDTLTIVEERFERRLATVEANIIKWMFNFWVGQVGVITGILFAFFRR